MISMKIKTAVGAAFFIVLGGVIWWQSLDLSTMGAVFPRVIAIAMILTSVLIVLRMFLAKSVLYSEREEEAPKSGWRGFALMMTMGGWIILLKPLGLMLASVLAFAGLMFIAEQEKFRPLRMAIILIGGAIGIGAVTLAMTEVLMVPVPKGILF